MPEARRQVIRVETVEQVLDPQPQVGIAFDHQATPEKQGIRVFLPTGQQQELPPVATNGHVYRRFLGNAQATAITGDTPGQAEITDFQAHPAPLQQVEVAIGQRLGKQARHGLLKHQTLEQKRHMPAQRQQRFAHAQGHTGQLQHKPASSAPSMPGRPCQ